MGNGSSVQAGRSSAGIREFCWSQPLQQQQQQEAVVTEVVVEVAGGSGAGRADEEASRG